MKAKSALRHFLALAGSSLLAMSSAHAQTTLYFDGTPTTADGASSGGTGNWDLSTANWDNGTGYVAWNNANSDNAIITNGATITIGAPITAGTLTFTSGGVAGRNISGSEITINNGMYLERLSSLTWNAAIKLGASQTWTHNQITANSTGKSMAGGTNLDGHTLTWDTTNVQSNNRITHQNITGSGSIIKNGTGWLGLGGTNTYTGSTTINAGTIDAVSSTALGNANNQLTVNTGGTLNIAGNFGLTVGNLTGTGGVITTTGGNTTTRTLTTGSGDATGGNFQGQISDGSAPIALTKTGTGTIALSGSNIYSGATNVSNGKLRIANSTGSATGTGVLNLSGGATTTLSGTGISTGSLTVTNSSRIAAGINTTGTNGNFGAAGTLSLGTLAGMTLTNANLDFDLASLTTVGGGVNDLILTGGVLSLTGSEAFTFNLLNATLDTATAYTLISGASSVSFASGDTSTWTTNFVNSSAYTANYSFSGNDLQVTFAAIPEPGAALLGSLGLLLLLRRRR